MQRRVTLTAPRDAGWRVQVTYRYTDTADRIVPEYAADRIRIRAHYARMARSLLSPLADALRDMPGFVSLTVVADDAIKRPQVVASFDRAAAAR